MGIQWLCLVIVLAIANTVFCTITLAPDNEIPAFSDKFSYPLSGGIGVYKIVVLSNMQDKSKRTNADNTVEWISHMRRGSIALDNGNQTVTVKWDKPKDGEKEDVELTSQNSNESGQGFELTDLVGLNGVLVAVDEATGLAYLYDDNKLKSWLVVKADNQESSTGMKIKWAFVEEKTMYVGTNGIDNSNNVAKVLTSGKVDYEDWSKVYAGINGSRKNQDGSTMVHQSVGFSRYSSSYFFLPRYIKSSDSKVKPQSTFYSVSKDLKTFKEEFTIEDKHEDRSYTSFKLIPLTQDSIVIAIQTAENSDESYITAFDTDGTVYCKSSIISSSIRYNTVEFV